MSVAQDLPTQVRRERLAGLVLIATSGAALAAANSPLAHAYHDLLHLELGPVLPKIGALTVHAAVADGLMAVFFLLVGMEVKREWVEGKLSSKQARRLPIIAAAAGMVVPALVFLSVTGLDPRWAHGWAIPTATDIAFAIAVLAILGTHAPPSIKVMLVTIAVVDDVGAVAIIAIAYTSSVDTLALGAAAGLVALMALTNIMGVRRTWPYLLGFAGLWWLVLSSGIHATIAGVLAALTIPLGPREKHSTLEHLEHKIHPWVMFGVVPLFGFVSAGVQLPGFAKLLEPLPQIYGASILTGVGFTMSLFIGGLAFPGDPAAVDSAKIGTLAGSLLAAVMGWAVLRASSPVPWVDDQVQAALRIFAFEHTEPDRERKGEGAGDCGCDGKRLD